MGALADLLDKLQFWRDDPPAGADVAAGGEIDACFTLPGAEIDDACVEESSADESRR